jgi:prostaglandin-H2 D-isomerase / glutathione transferase
MVHYERNLEIQAEKRTVLNAETIPFYLNKLDEIAKENNGYLAVKRLTWADVYFAAMIDWMNARSQQDLTANHPNLKKVLTNVLEIEGIKKWVEKRPKTDA